MPKLSPQQRVYVRKHSKVEEPDPSEVEGELNIVPFLDILIILLVVLLMLTLALATFSQINTRLPESRRGGIGSGRQDESLNLNLTITDKGVIVAGSGGKLARGCEETASGRALTVPKLDDGNYDWKGLTECVYTVHQEYPEERRVTVTADPLIEFEHVIEAMDAVRKKGDEELFPDVLLSAGVR